MEKRYQVFVSSTFSDLKLERQAVMEALLSLDHFPAGMELFPASNEDQLTLIKGVIDDSDYYVLVIGGRYGSTDAQGISYTEREFDYAVAKKKPILAFIHQDPKLIPTGKTDENDTLRKKLDTFKRKVESGRHIKYWSNPDDLKAKIIQGIAAETKRNPQEGWVRTGLSTNPAMVESLRQEIDRLRHTAQEARLHAPEGSEIYAFGDDIIEIYFDYDDSQGNSHSKAIKVTWNTVFGEVGPLLLEEANEDQIKERLSTELWRYDRKFPQDAEDIEVQNDSFDDVKIQFLALGLIEKSQKKHASTNTNKYWALSAYGETTLMRVRAKRRPTTNAPDRAAAG